MMFESLANELLFNIFEYFSTAQLLHLFYGLNHRFNMLLFDHICIRGLDLRAVSKRDIDTLCQQCLPSITNRITTLCLSDAENSQQTKYFIVEGLTRCQFTHLRTLHLYDLTSVTTINKMILYCCYLSHLTYLKLDHCYCSPCNQTDVVNIVNIIWSLSNLIYCYLDIDSGDDIEFSVPKIISSSLEYLTIPNMICCVSELTYLVEYTPHLQYLSVRFTFDSDNSIPYPMVVNSSIIHFDTWLVAVERNEIIHLFLHMPNLCSLTVQTMNDVFVDGRQWEQIIRDHLTKLKRFRLKLTRKLVNDSNWQQHVDELIDSFRSQFWLEERRWFVQCDWDPDVAGIYLYTLPYAFDRLTLNFPLISKSTCPHDACQRSYDRVRQLKYIPSLSDDLGKRRISFPNVQNLTIYLPINNHLWTIIPKFHQLTSLCVAWYKYDESFPSQLQLLLDRANRLYSLGIETWRSCPTRMAPYKLTHASIRKLDFYNYHYHYNNEDCTILSRSLLGMQCEVLRISVENRTCILDLVKQMTNLHHLIVQCLDDKYSEESMTIADELVIWLQDQMPSTFTITRNIILAHEIDLWID